MDTETVVTVSIAIGLLLLAYVRGGGLWLSGLERGARLLWGLLPLLLISFAVAGRMQVLIPKDQIRHWLGADAGSWGIVIGGLVDGPLPGSPCVTCPIVASLYDAGAGIGAVVGFVTGKGPWSVSRIPFEIAVLGPA